MYSQLKVKDTAIPRTDCRSQYGHYAFVVILRELRNTWKCYGISCLVSSDLVWPIIVILFTNYWYVHGMRKNVITHGICVSNTEGKSKYLSNIDICLDLELRSTRT